MANDVMAGRLGNPVVSEETQDFTLFRLARESFVARAFYSLPGVCLGEGALGRRTVFTVELDHRIPVDDAMPMVLVTRICSFMVLRRRGGSPLASELFSINILHEHLAFFV